MATSIKKYLALHREEMILFLKDLVTLETPSKVMASQQGIFDVLLAKLEAMCR